MVKAFVDRASELPKGYVHDLAVKLELERSEVTKILLERALAWLHSGGAESAQAYVRDDNDRALQSPGLRANSLL